MSLICQTFVQNTWRNDLCSNCFKSKEEHGGSSYSCSQGTRREYSSDGPLARRYLGVTGRSLYNRNYYGNPSSTWTSSSCLENKDPGFLKSPGLIHRMDSIIKQENEKNARLNALKGVEDYSQENPLPIKSDYGSDFVDSVKKDAWILNEIISNTKNFEFSEDKIPKDKDCSSDLGSDASHDTSVSSADNSTCSDLASSGRSSSSELKEVDGDSVKSYTGDEALESEPELVSILKISNLHPHKKILHKISFNETDRVIGFGGDVDYSDEEDYEYDEDTDDDDSVCSLELPLDERELKYLTEKNTNFNSEIENFESVKDQQQGYISPTENKDSTSPKPEGRVKLKRCPPLVTTKPVLKSTLSSGSAPSTTCFGQLSEDIPLKGIKPKYVSREDEMRERWEDELFEKRSHEKVTSIDSCHKVTSIDDIIHNKDTAVVGQVAKIDSAISYDTYKNVPRKQEFNNQKREELTKHDLISSMKDNEKIHFTSSSFSDQSPTYTTKFTHHKEHQQVFEQTQQQTVFPKEVVDKSTSDIPKQNTCALIEAKSNPSPLTKCSSDDTLDYTVRSAHPIKMRYSHENLLQSDDQKTHINAINSAVIPMNMITIQRRNSFMESQLGGPIYSADHKTSSKAQQSPKKEVEQQQVSGKIEATETNKTSEPHVDKSHPTTINSSEGPKKEIRENQIQNSTLDLVQNGNKDHGVMKPQVPIASTKSNASIPQSSFLHSRGIKAIQNGNVNNSAVEQLSNMPGFPAAPIVADQCHNPVRSFNNSSLPFSKACVSSVPSSKPATTPKPTFLKDRPKLSSKPSPDNISSQNISSTTEKIYAKPTVCSGASFKPSLAKVEKKDENVRQFNSEKSLKTVDISSSENFSASSSTNGSTSVSTSTTTSTIYPTTQTFSSVSSNSESIVDQFTNSSSKSSEVSNEQEVLSHYRATFEANRSLLSTALNLGSNIASTIKRQAPRPPQEDDEVTVPFSKISQDPAPQDAISKQSVPTPKEGTSPNFLNTDKDPSLAVQPESEKLPLIEHIKPNLFLQSELNNHERTTPIVKVGSQEKILGNAPDTQQNFSTQIPLCDQTNLDKNEPVEQTILQSSQAEETIVPNSQVPHQLQIQESLDCPGNPITTPYLSPQYENIDMESYSSFTDDFDDDDECGGANYDNENGSDVFVPMRRPAERSSSANPLNRASVGPIIFCQTNSNIENPDTMADFCGKQPAVRSHSVPRSVENAIDLRFKSKHDSSKFSFVKNGFFRPSSPPTIKRKSSSERGRERAKRPHSVGFSLKKLLRLGSHEKPLKASKLLKSMKDQEWDRETRKLKLQIIHPLDYNPNGVEVIARPEKTSPIYDYTGFYDNTNLPEIGSGSNFGSQKEVNRSSSFLPGLNTDSRNTDSPSPAPSSTISSSNHSSSETGGGGSTVSLLFGKKSKKNYPVDGSNHLAPKKVEKKNSFLKKRRKPERRESLTFGKAQATYVKQDKLQTPGIENSADNAATSLPSCQLSTASSVVAISTNKATLNSGDLAPTVADVGQVSSYPSGTLGFNSEGRPKPPPPPRKTSLESSSTHEVVSAGSSHSSEAGDIPPSGRTLSSSEINLNTVRPHRPPPPRRTPSNAGPPYPEGSARQAAYQMKSSLYANLGEARVAITPRKPGRSCSVKDEEKEKRKAPNPPTQNPTEISAITFNSNSGAQLRPTKGPAPPTPTNPHLLHILSHEYEYIDDDSPVRNVEKATAEGTTSSSSYAGDKASVQSSADATVRNRSLEDQYGAVVNANLEALSNFLDQVCTQPESSLYKQMEDKVTCWSSVHLTSGEPISCGSRFFYEAKAAGMKVSLMVTPEVKVEIDPLLMPAPIASFKDEIPARILLRTKAPADKHSTTPGSVWLLPHMRLHSIDEFSHTSQRLLEQHPKQWERHICLFLLQLVTALKHLQAKGIEETSLDFILVSKQISAQLDNKSSTVEQYPRLILVSNSQSIASANHSISLCHCAASATQLLLGHSNPIESGMKGPVLSPPFTPNPHAFSILVTTLREERATSLTKAKCLLEVMLFGPNNLRSPSDPDLEASLEKWLDLERAKVLHTLVSEAASSTSTSRSIWTKFQLFFLVRTSLKSLRESTLALQIPDVTNF